MLREENFLKKAFPPPSPSFQKLLKWETMGLFYPNNCYTTEKTTGCRVSDTPTKMQFLSCYDSNLSQPRKTAPSPMW